MLIGSAPLMATVLAVPAQTRVTATAPQVAAGHGVADFNGDGFADLAVGVAMEDVGTAADAGAVNILDGASTGLTSAGSRLITQDNAGMPDVAETGDNFGAAVAAGDFNGDGFSDLAVGAHFEDLGSVRNAGAVHVLSGSASGLTTPGNQYWNQDTGSVLETAESGDMFGASLATGDLNGDGYADLVIGVREEDVASANSAGAVNVLYGSAAGLTEVGNQLWTQDTPGLMGEGAETGDVFSRGLGVGDFNGDGFDDVGIGAWEEDVGTIVDAGAVNVLHGSLNGLTTNDNQYWTQDSVGILEDAETNDWFGRPVTAGDFNGDGFDDMAVGAHRETLGAASAAGVVNVLYGSAIGLTSASNQLWSQDSTDVFDQAESGDHFARTTAAGDVNADGYDDLAIGVSEEGIGAQIGAGSVTVLLGSPTGLIAAGNQSWTQDSPNIRDSAEAGDSFGWYVQLSDVDGNGSADLASSAAYEDTPAAADVGIVHVLLGGAAGLTSTSNQLWSQDSRGIKDVAEAGDAFGVIME